MRQGGTVVATEYGAGSANFVGGTDAAGALLTVTTAATHLAGGNSFTYVNAPNTFVPLVGAASVKLSITAKSATGVDVSDFRTFFIGGRSSTTGAPTATVAVFNGATGAFTPSITTSGTAPSGRTGAAAAYLSRCNMTDPAVPQACIVVVGGQSATALLNDVWALWLTESPPRWQLIAPDTGAAALPAGRPSQRSGAVGASSTDGTTMYMYGGVAATGPTADMFALAPAGFQDPLYPDELVNIAPGNGQCLRSTFLAQYSGPENVVISGLIPPLGKGSSPNNVPLVCWHSDNEREPWIRIRFNTSVNIDAVRITPRSDCCPERMKAFRIVVSATDPNNGPPPSGKTGELTQRMPNMGVSPAFIPFSKPVSVTYMWVALRDLGFLRFMTLCEIEVLQKRPWVWRQLSGLANVALGMPASQMTTNAANE